MTFWRTENKIEPKQNFYSEIENFYVELSDNRIPTDLLNEIISMVTNQIYGDYQRFWKQYPKSRKRYSKLRMEDIEHPFIHYLITDFLERKRTPKSEQFQKILFKMNDAQFEKYLEQKRGYETK
ncbi:hypothetical protein [Gaetbulibacter aestuarii]|uniref:Uncharacterized protein n=1 Tax=Gaetbulibacter aestuarii TaxID=1502358 RepID=A0ABW7N0A7_9FLAO